jgi:sugar (pentulose or hexulose) kinase
MALSTIADKASGKNSGVAMHYGFLPDSYVMLPVAESGGVSLEWFHRNCMGDMDYDTMNRLLSEREPNALLFLPYLVGTNAPEFDGNATGVFWGLRQEHDAVDMAGAVMEGVSFLLRKNCDHLRAKGVCPTAIIATGGGSKSPVWCRMQADITGIPVYIPTEKEAACLGAAIIAAVSYGTFRDYETATKACVSFSETYEPCPQERLERKYRRFCKLYDASVEISNI